MKEANIFNELHEIKSLLSAFGLTKEELCSVAIEAISHTEEATSLHPMNAGGSLAYIHGVGGLRFLLLGKEGWKIDRTNGMEGTTNSSLNITIFYQNVDVACGYKTPHAISKKGEGAKKLLDNNSQSYLFDYMQEEDDEKENKNIWFLCVSSNNGEVRAELSLPRSIEGSQFSSFSERIFLLTDNDWDLTDSNDSSDDDDQDFDISVTRK